MEPQTLAVTQEIDFSTLALFFRATFTVKIVMLVLIGMSFWSWSIVVQKYILYRLARARMDKFDQLFWSGEPLDRLYESLGTEPTGGAERVFSAAMREWHQSHRRDGALIPGVISRIDRAMNVAIGREADKLTAGLGVLATTGATAPFIGLFGTIWGIKHSFEQIALSQNTSLAVVAPGIAEALMATGIGLVAAIPAVVFYNKLNADCERIVNGYEVFADEFTTIVSRQMDA